MSPQTTLLEKPIPRHRKLKVFLISIVVIGVALVLTQQLWLPKVLVGYVLYKYDNPQLYMVPTDRSLPIGVASSSTYAIDDITFSTPWQRPIKIRENATTTPGLGYMAINFADGSSSPAQDVVILANPPINFIGNDPRLQNFLGDQLKTNFDMYNYVAHLTPNDVHLFGSNKDLLAKNVLLLLKATQVPFRNSEPYYQFTTVNGIRGYEVVESATSTVAVFFSPADKQYTLIIHGATPSEVDSILQSIMQSNRTQVPNGASVDSPSPPLYAGDTWQLSGTKYQNDPTYPVLYFDGNRISPAGKYYTATNTDPGAESWRGYIKTCDGPCDFYAGDQDFLKYYDQTLTKNGYTTYPLYFAKSNLFFEGTGKTIDSDTGAVEVEALDADGPNGTVQGYLKYDSGDIRVIIVASSDTKNEVFISDTLPIRSVVQTSSNSQIGKQ